MRGPETAGFPALVNGSYGVGRTFTTMVFLFGGENTMMGFSGAHSGANGLSKWERTDMFGRKRALEIGQNGHNSETI